MRVFLLILVLLLSSCASTQTEKQKEDRKKLTIIRTIGCAVVPTCIVPENKMNYYIHYQGGAGGDFLRVCLWLLLNPKLEIDWDTTEDLEETIGVK